MNREHTIAISADPSDLEDRDVSAAGIERGLMGRRIRMLRNKLGLSQDQFANRYGIPVANILQWETGPAEQVRLVAGPVCQSLRNPGCQYPPVGNWSCGTS